MRMWRNGNAPSIFRQVWPFLKWLNGVYYMIQHYTPRYILKSTENLSLKTFLCPHKNLHTYVRNIIYNNENGHNPNVHQLNVYPQNGILFNHKKKGMTHAVTQRNHKLSQRGHSQRTAYHAWLHLLRTFRIRESKVGGWLPGTGYWRDC